MPTLDWVNKGQALEATRAVPIHLLKQEAVYGDPDARDNLLIQGDNLLALKALLPFYEGQVKCVYADPPFNTGQALAHYDDKLEHSIWLSLLYPAMSLTRRLLAEDGTFFVHIDDNELGYLVAILDEIMGRKNRVAVVTFKQGAPTGHKAINPGMVSTTNFLVVYAKNKSAWKPNRVFTGRDRDKRYGTFLINPDDAPTQWKFSTLSAAVSKATGKKMKDLKKDLGDGLENFLNDFVVEHAAHVTRLARPDYKAVGEDAKQMIDVSLGDPTTVYHLARKGFPDMYFIGGERVLFYTSKLKEVDGAMVAGEPLTTLWDDLLSNNLHKEGGVEFPKSKKPEALIKRCIDLATNEGELVLDSYLGSGTTAATAHKMKRHWIGIERGEHAETKCLPRLKATVDGEQSGISKSVAWQGGGGFRFCTLGEPAFDADGRINPEVKFATLASFIWHYETATPAAGKFRSPMLGVHGGTAYYLLYNGILGDLRARGGNVLTRAVLTMLQESYPHAGPKVIYGEVTRLGDAALAAANATFKQIPYDIKAR